MDAPRRGNGLPFAADRVSGRGTGRFEIRSGDASLHVGSYQPVFGQYPVDRNGVQVSMVLRALPDA